MFTVKATDASGATATGSYTWRIGKRLVLTGVRQSRNRWRERVGTVFKFTLNAAARVTFTFTKSGPGRRVSGVCVATTGTNRRRPRCRRTIVLGAIGVHAHRGPNSLSFAGRLGPGARLGPGGYAVFITANAGDPLSAQKSLRFTVVAG